MNTGKLVFAQLTAHLPLTTFRRCVARYDGEHKVKKFSCLEQFLIMAFAQMTYRESLRDIEACLEAQPTKALSHGTARRTSRAATLADANERCDWRLHCEFAQASDTHRAQAVRHRAARLCESGNTVYALDSTTIDLCLTLFPWAPFRSTKAAIKLHTLLDLRGDYPQLSSIFPTASWHDVNVLDLLIPGSRRVLRDGPRLSGFRASVLGCDQSGGFFVTRAKRNMNFQRVQLLARSIAARD